MKHSPMERYLDMYPPTSDEEREAVGASIHKPSAKRLPVEAELDLHGMTVEQAAKELDQFISESRSAGLKKVLIVQGKGSHENSDGVLRQAVRSHLEQHPDVGTIGIPSARQGGSGAIFAMLRLDSLGMS